MPNRKVTAPVGALGLVALLLAAAPQRPSAGEAVLKAAAGVATVQIDNFAFAPATLTVTAGTTVTWKNDDDDAHSVVEKARKFKSAALDTDDTFSQTFTAPGQYEYFCSIHPHMVGKIVVQPTGS
jgi:plastocyanin